MELRRFIGANPGDMLGYADYRLNKLYALRGDRKEALKHLGIGRNLRPKLGYRSNEELAALVHGGAEFRPTSDEFPQEYLE